MATSREVRDTRWSNLPGNRSDVVEDTAEDLRRSKRGRNVDTSELRGGAREAVREAGQRATNRNLGRLGAVGAALQGGYEVGSEINKRTGLSDKIVDTLSRDSKRERAIKKMLDADEESDVSIMRKVDAQIAAEKAAQGTEPEPEYRGGPAAYKKGGVVKSVSASRRADGIAQRGKTRGKMV